MTQITNTEIPRKTYVVSYNFLFEPGKLHFAQTTFVFFDFMKNIHFFIINSLCQYAE